jgi:hypothetical protein
MQLTDKQRKAMWAKNGRGGISSKSHKAGNKQITIKQKPIPAPIIIPKKNVFIPKGDIRHMLTEQEIEEWEQVAGSEVVSAEKGKFEGRNTIEVKFQNGENWFEFQTMGEQKDFFENADFRQNESVGKFIKVDHPKIEGYVNLWSGLSLFKDRLMTEK